MSDVAAPSPGNGIQDFSVALYRDRDEALDPEVASLLRVDRLAQLTVEMTTSCNLACVYCHFAPLDRRGKDLSGDLVEKVIDFVTGFPVDIISIGGDSELTMYKGWEEVAQRLLDAGCNLRTISNFTNGIFSPSQVDAFSRFTEILVSLDTADPELLKKTRYRADLRTMTLNVQQIRARCIETGRPQPRLVCNAVVSDKTFGKLDKLAAFAIANGFDCLSLQRLVALDEVPGGKNDFFDNPNAIQLFPIATLQEQEALEALNAYQRMLTLCLNRIPLAINPALTEDVMRLLNQFANDNSAETDGADVGLPLDGRTTHDDGRTTLTDGRTVTKACLMPWNYMHVMWDGNVPPCCIVKEGYVGNADERPLAEIFNSEEMQSYRAGLLTGQMNPLCAECTYVPETDTASLQKSVRNFLLSTGQSVVV